MSLEPRRRSGPDQAEEREEETRSAGGAFGTPSTLNYAGSPIENSVIGTPYDYAVHEAMPKDPSTHPNFITSEKLVREAVFTITSQFDLSTVPDRELAALVKELHGLRKLDYGEPIKVGLVGEAGIGKSSLINAVLGQPLASAGDSGCSCTQVVTEYADSGPLSIGWLATVQFKDKKSIDKEVERNVRAYIKNRPRKKHSRAHVANPASTETTNILDAAIAAKAECSRRQNAQSPSTSGVSGHPGHLLETLLASHNHADNEDYGSDTSSADDCDDLEEGASQRELFKTAEDFLMQLYAPSLDLKTPLQLEKEMSAVCPETFESKVDYMQQIIHETLRQEFGRKHCPVDGNHLVIRKASNEELMAELKKYTDQQPFGEQAFWPIVQYARVEFSSPFLRNGIVLSDCPGLNDSNLSRRRNTTSHLDDCHVFLIMAASDRILDNPSIARALDRYIPQVGISRVLIAPTKCEVVQHNPSGRGVSEADVNCLRDLQKSLEAKKKAWREAKSPATKAEHKGRWKSTERVLTRKRIQIRNKAFVEEARRQYGRGARASGGLVVIPTSSAVHEQWLAGDIDDDVPILTVHEDGIARIRATLTMIARSTREHTLRRHIELVLPTAFNSLQLTLGKTLNQRMGEALMEIETSIKDIIEPLNDYTNTLSSVTKRGVLEIISSTLTAPEGLISMKLDLLVQDWKSRYNNGHTFAAFARKNGVHMPNHCKEVADLNQDVIALAKQTIADFVARLGLELDPLREAVYSHGMSQMEGLRSKLSSMPALVAFDLDSLWANFAIHQVHFNGEVTRFIRKFVDALHAAFMRVVSDNEDTFYNIAMHKSWLLAKNSHFSGPAIVHQRFDHLRAAISMTESEGPLEELMRQLNLVAVEVVKLQKQAMAKLVKAPFERVKKDVQLKFTAGKERAGFDAEFRKQAKAKVTEAMKGAKEHIANASKHLGECHWEEQPTEHGNGALVPFGVSGFDKVPRNLALVVAGKQAIRKVAARRHHRGASTQEGAIGNNQDEPMTGTGTGDAFSIKPEPME